MRHFAPRNLRTVCLSFGATLLAMSGAGCGSTADGGHDIVWAGPVMGPLDNHCQGHEPVVVNIASCHPTTPDAGSQPAPGSTAEPEAAILFNGDGDDDDCKYHVRFMNNAAKVDQKVTMQVTVTHLADGKPAVNADVDIESYLAENDGHVIPNNGAVTTEAAGSGVYTISPLKFDAAGRWVVRFHLYETCSDAKEDSPHGHVAFYLDVAP